MADDSLLNTMNIPEEKKDETPENGSGGEVVGQPTVEQLLARAEKAEAGELKALAQLSDDHSKFVEATDILVKENERPKAENLDLDERLEQDCAASDKEIAALKQELIDLRASVALPKSGAAIPAGYVVTRTENARDVVEHIQKRNVSEDALVLVLEKAGA